MESFKSKQRSSEMLRVIEKDDSTSSMTTDSEDSGYNRRPFRQKAAKFLDTNRCHVAVVLTVAVDVLLIIIELVFNLDIIRINAANSIAQVVHYFNLAILGLFILEISFRIIIFRLDYFRYAICSSFVATIQECFS